MLQLDAWLLKITEKVVRRFNWLTGKDNFWLAKLFFAVGISSLMITFYIWMFVFPIIFFAGGLIVGLIGASQWLFIREQEMVSEKSALKGAKDLMNEMSLRNTRLTSLLAFFMYNIFFLGMPLMFFVPQLIFFASDIVINYLVSVEKPPFKRSMAIEWLKNKINELTRSLDPTPSPQPV